MGSSWDKIVRIFVEITIIIIKYYFGKREEEKVKVDNETKKNKMIDFCRKNNYNYYCK